MKHIQLFIIALFCFAGALNAQSFYSEDGKVRFLSKVQLHAFEGTSQNLVGLINLDESIIDFYLDLTTLNTGNGKRDKGMNLSLETSEFPIAEFYGTLTTQFDVENTEPQVAVAKGDFKIHGVSKEVEIEGTLQLTDAGLILKAAWVLKLSDYEIVPPRLLLLKVDENQKISLETLLRASEV